MSQSLATPTAEPAAHGAATLRVRRSPRLIAIGAVCICAGGLGAGFSYQQATHHQSVIIVQHEVQRGQAIKAGDLSVVSMGQAAGVSTVDASQLNTLIGQQALVDLAPGAVLPSGVVGTSSTPAGMSEIGLRLSAGRLPSHGLKVGSAITLVSAPGPKDAANVNLPNVQSKAVVLSAPQAGGDGQSYLLDIAVPTEMAAKAATLAAAERLVVIGQA